MHSFPTDLTKFSDREDKGQTLSLYLVEGNFTKRTLGCPPSLNFACPFILSAWPSQVRLGSPANSRRAQDAQVGMRCLLSQATGAVNSSAK